MPGRSGGHRRWPGTGKVATDRCHRPARREAKFSRNVMLVLPKNHSRASISSLLRISSSLACFPIRAVVLLEGASRDTWRVRAGYVQGTCRVHAGYMQGTCRVQDLRTCDQQDMVDREMICDGSEGDETVRSMSVADRRRGRHFSLLGKHPQPPLLHALNGHRGGGKSTQTRSPSALPA